MNIATIDDGNWRDSSSSGDDDSDSNSDGGIAGFFSYEGISYVNALYMYTHT